MNFRALVFPIVTITLVCCTVANRARAQNNATPIASSETSGVTVSIPKVSVDQKKIILQFTITNKREARIYVRDAAFERSQRGFLGSGEHFNQTPEISGIEICPAEMSACVLPTWANDLNAYSYIEPGKSTAFAITYLASANVSEGDTVSFSIPLIARASTSKTDVAQAGPPNPLRFNFPYVPLKHPQ
jgi:hypothetical protein